MKISMFGSRVMYDISIIIKEFLPAPYVLMVANAGYLNSLVHEG